jgi:hypothetical protein
MHIKIKASLTIKTKTPEAFTNTLFKQFSVGEKKQFTRVKKVKTNY